MNFVEASLESNWVLDKDVVEVGALDVNGSIRLLAENLRPKSYLATDITPGRGVDLICDARDLKPNSADLVLCFEMMEHAQDWRSAMLGMNIALRRDGILMLTTRSLGFPYHGYPYDFNRFSVDQMSEIIDALGMEKIECRADPSMPGIFVIARKTERPSPERLASITIDGPGLPPPHSIYNFGKNG